MSFKKFEILGACVKGGYSSLSYNKMNTRIPHTLEVALTNYVRKWRNAYYSVDSPWANRCVDCGKPLCCLPQKYVQCTNCWTAERMDQECPGCPQCQGPPQEEEEKPKKEEFCIVCGDETLGMGYEPCCSRRCYRQYSASFTDN